MVKRYGIPMKVVILVSFLILPGLVDAQSVSGHIIDVSWPSSKSSCGYSDRPVITIENTGSEAHEFWIQVEAQDPTGKWHGGGAWFAHTDIIAPGKEDRFSDILITIDPCYSNMPKGYYNGRITLYDDFYKHNRLDSQTRRNAFEAE